ncbi:hypothetical protein ABZT03_07575 [Streptomyces sp. NPDC005574]|uniref:hypothetical protein n=1 Tax=Streptomyces sp. NPDC005574 TaxID=3156891 RepID=UPI0033A48914
MNDGFCQVGSRPLNRASATEARPSVMARWIGGSPDQEAATTGPPPADTGVGAGAAAPAGDGGAAVVAVVVSVRLRSRSRNAIGQPSDPARVTRDAICCV